MEAVRNDSVTDNARTAFSHQRSRRDGGSILSAISGASVPAHNHRDADEFLYASLKARFTSSSTGKCTRLAPADAIFIPRGKVQPSREPALMAQQRSGRHITPGTIGRRYF